MSSPLQRLTLGRRSDNEQARAVMLSRLGIVEEKPHDIFRQPEPEPIPQVEALAAPPASPAPAAEPAQAPPWARSPANDEQPEVVEARSSFAIPTPPAPAEVEEDPIEAIRQRYRQPPPSGLSLPSNIHLPSSLPFAVAPVGERRRKAGELSTARKVIWGLSTLTALIVGWALLKGDESNVIVQVFGMLLP